MRLAVYFLTVFCLLFLQPHDSRANQVHTKPSAADIKTAKAAFKAADQRRWKKARRLAKRIKDPLTYKLFRWHDLVQPNSGNSFEMIRSFLDKNPDWPDRKGLRRRAEEAMSDKLDPHQVLQWFQDDTPVSTDGWVRLGWALMKTDRKTEARDVIRQTWVERNFSKRPEKSFYKRYRKLLTTADHLDRMDRLLWEGKNWPVRRMLWKIPKEYRSVAEARLMLRHRFGNVDKAIARIPKEQLSDPGLIYERLRWRRKKGRFEQSVELLSPAPDTEIRPDLWWNERAYLARMALQKGHITDAYRLASEHRLSKGKDYAEAEWLSGWVALRFLEDPKLAIKHFVAMFDSVNYPISKARGAYWSARAAEAMNDNKAADMWYRTASRYPTVYYGQLAASRKGKGHGLQLPEMPIASKEETRDFVQHELVRAIEVLDNLGQNKLMRPFAKALADARKTPGWRALATRLIRLHGRPDLSISIAKKLSREGQELIEAGYPLLTPPKLRTRSAKHHLETPLVLAMIRQESAFRSGATSHASARGLMQLMPATAKRVAKRLRISYSKKRLLTDPKYNMVLGQSYLAGLLDEFDGSYVLSLAAYNAGPARARRWSRENGQPGITDIDTIDWVEMVPFRETRNYIQRVLENLQVYRLMLAETEVAESLSEDLKR